MKMIANWKVEEKSEPVKSSSFVEKVYPKAPDEPSNITFQGKFKSFVSAAIKTKELFKKGARNDMSDLKALVLDVNAKAATEVTLEITDSKEDVQ